MTEQLPPEHLLEAVFAGAAEAVFYQYPEPMYILSLEGVYIECNDALVHRLGIPKAEIIGSSFSPAVVDKHRDVVHENFLAATRGEIVTFEAEGRHSDGSIFTASVINTPLRVSGTVAAVLGIARNIDELYGARQERDRLAYMLETTLNSITDGLFILDAEWNFTFLNPRAEQIANVASAELVGRSMWDAFPDMHGSEFGIGYKRAVAEQTRVITRERYAPFDAVLEATAYPTVDGLAVYVRDVTAEENARSRVAEQDQQLRAQAELLDTARDAIIVRQLDHTVTYWNRAATDLYGWTADEARGLSVRENLYAAPEEFDLATATVVATGKWSGDIEQVARDGRTIIADCRWSLVRNADGEPTAIFAVNTDVTERRRQEALSMRAQRMESLGTLAGGIAHDLNNVLTPLLMSVQMLAARETDESKLSTLGIIESSAKRGADMLRQVLAFARGIEGRRIQVDTNRLIADTDSFCSETLPKSITVHSNAEHGAWKTVGDPTQLLQVLLNLVSNARDAMPRGGDLHLSARNIDVTEPFRLRLPAAGRYVLIEVEDTGSGMSPEVIEQAFDPFFTTKAVGEGTGLGLATSVAIVRSHGGNLQVYSEEGVGSRFEIYLPAADDQGSAAQRSSNSMTLDAPRGAGELILVVDDEAAIRQSARETLARSGYTVVVAGNGREALDYLHAMNGKVDLIFSDLTMPVMNGIELLAKADSEYPTLPVLISSGLTGTLPPSPENSAGRAFIAKPYTTNDLLWAISGLLRR